MKARIMVVDDDPTIRYAVRRLLAAKGYRVVCADDGTQCLEELDSLRGDVGLMIMDISMPKMDGITAFYKAKKEHPHVKVIFLSAMAMSRAARRSLGSGGRVPYIDKPFDGKDLLDKVKEALGDTR